jgi:hypothetical protein
MLQAGKLLFSLLAGYHWFLLSVMARVLLIGIVIAGWISA